MKRKCCWFWWWRRNLCYSSHFHLYEARFKQKWRVLRCYSADIFHRQVYVSLTNDKRHIGYFVQRSGSNKNNSTGKPLWKTTYTCPVPSVGICLVYVQFWTESRVPSRTDLMWLSSLFRKFDYRRPGTGKPDYRGDEIGTRETSRDVPTGKTGLPSEQFHFFWEFSCRANRETFFI